MTGYARRGGKHSPFRLITRKHNEKMVEREARKERFTMPNMNRVIVPLMYGQVRIEIEITSEDDESLTLPEIKGHIDWLISEGLQPISFGGNREDNIGEKGSVVSVKNVDGTKMFEVTGKLDNNKEFKWRVFDAHTFRIRDRFIVVRNDRGFKAGELVLDDLEQQELDL